MAHEEGHSGFVGHPAERHDEVERRARELFEAAILLADEERWAFVSRLREPPAVRRRLEALFESDATPLSALDGSIAQPRRGGRLAPSGETPRSIGPYRIEARLATGGTSVVYLGRREGTVAAPQVAVKWIREEWAERNLGRVLREARLLSQLEHPGIARLLDVGTASGRPFFVMEYVHGTPITEYCDAQRLAVKDRLELFEQVCAAVSFAHQNLVVHRDLKPANILVTPHGEPKLLDFGISAALDPGSAERTATLPLFLTPSYASPEQINGRGITTASDVYALGVLLFELLTGERPFEFSHCAPHEIYALLGRDAAPLASGRLRERRELHGVAAARSTTPEALLRQLDGDVDNILRKAMRFDPRDRYASVEQLMQDARRFLDGHPVEARSPTPYYRARKFVRRHSIGVLNVLLLMAALAGLVVERQMHSVRVERERDLARQAQESAEEQREKAEGVVDFLVDSFAAADPYTEPSPDVTAREILERGAAKLRTELEDSPGARATLLQTIGRVYLRLGLHDRAEQVLAEALRLHREGGSAKREIAEALLDLAAAQAAAGHYELAGGAAEEAVALFRRLDSAEPGGGLPEALRTLAETRGHETSFGEAEALAREALDLSRRRFGERHAQTAEAYAVLMEVIYRAGDAARAEDPARRSLELAAELHGPSSLDAAGAANDLGAVLWASGRYEESEELYRRALAIRRQRLEPGHPLIAESLNNLGNLHMNLAHYERAEELLREALEVNTAALGDAHPNTVLNRANLANVLSARGEYDEAERLYREAWAINRETLGDRHPEVTIVMHNLADLLALRGRSQEARELFERAEALRLEAGEDNARLAATQFGLARALHQTGELEAAVAKYSECLARFRRELGEEHWRTANARVHYAELLADLGRLEEAERTALEAVAAYRSSLPADHWRRAVADSILADIRARSGRVEPALAALEDAWARLRRSKGEAAAQTREAQRRLARWAPTVGR